MPTTYRHINEIRQSTDGKKTIAVINSSSLDRHGTIIDPDGIDLANYARNPVFLINHDYDRLAGNGAIIRKQDGKLIAEVPDEAWDMEDPEIVKWYRKVKDGKMKMTSIGFTYDYNDVIEEERVMENGDTVRIPVIRKSELLEFSFVTVGSNPDALVLQRQATERLPELMKAINERLDKVQEKLSKLPEIEYIRALIEESAENTQPQEQRIVEPAETPELPTPPAVDRNALIQAEVDRIVNQIKQTRGQA